CLVVRSELSFPHLRNHGALPDYFRSVCVREESRAGGQIFPKAPALCVAQTEPIMQTSLSAGFMNFANECDRPSAARLYLRNATEELHEGGGAPPPDTVRFELADPSTGGQPASSADRALYQERRADCGRPGAHGKRRAVVGRSRCDAG